MNNSTVQTDLQAPFSLFFKKIFLLVVDVKILEGPGGADGVILVEYVHVHKAHGLARADHMAAGLDHRAGNGQKVMNIRAARDGGALLWPGEARGEAGGRVHDRADQAAVDLAVIV